jgi:VWFA-related protein
VSGSVRGKRIKELQRASHALVDSLRPGDRAALITFAERLRLRPPLTADVEKIRASIDGLTPEGGTSLVDGAFAAMALGDGVPGRAVAIVFTDGRDTWSWLPEADVLEAARRTEVVVYGVEAGNDARSFLGHLASTTGGRVLSAGSSDRLPQAFLEILNEVRTRYVLSYTPRGVERRGWHRLEVRLPGRSARVLSRKGYLVAQ